MIALVATASAHADSVWVGKVQVRLVHRGSDTTTAFDGQPIVYNLGDYNTFSVSFELYEQGVTDNPGVSVWQSVDAQVQLVKDSTQEVINSGSIPVVGTDGNNAVYNIRLVTLNPDTVSHMDPELQNRQTMKTHLNVTLNGGQVLSIPIDYQYAP
jgi:hypothetical protein